MIDAPNGNSFHSAQELSFALHGADGAEISVPFFPPALEERLQACTAPPMPRRFAGPPTTQ